MRKLFIFLWTSLLTTFAFAQQDGWVKQTNKADELLGQKEETLFVYQSSSNKGFLAFRDDYKNNPFVVIASLSLAAGNNDSYALDFVNNEMGLGSINVLVGYYIGENLVEKETIKGAVAFKAPSSIMFTDNQGTKIIEHLLSKGSVRFVAPYKSGGHLDLSVPCVSFAPEQDGADKMAQQLNSSQKKQWVTKNIPADELKREKGGIAFVYDDGNGCVTIRDNESIVEFCTYTFLTFDYNVKPIAKALPFKPYSESHYERGQTYYWCVDAIVGYYINGSLNNRESVSFHVDKGGNLHLAYPEPEVSKRIINHLKNIGSIRVIIPVVGGDELNISVPRLL